MRHGNIIGLVIYNIKNIMQNRNKMQMTYARTFFIFQSTLQEVIRSTKVGELASKHACIIFLNTLN